MRIGWARKLGIPIEYIEYYDEGREREEDCGQSED